MNKEIDIAIKKGHMILVKSTDGYTATGIPEKSQDKSRLKMRTIEGPVWIPYSEVALVSRIIPFPQ